MTRPLNSPIATAFWLFHLAALGSACGSDPSSAGGSGGGGTTAGGGGGGAGTTAGSGGGGGTTAGSGGALPAGGSGGSTGGAPTSGGSSGSGGISSGGASASGGTSGGGTAGCLRPSGSCAAPQIQITEVNVGMEVIAGGNEGDTLPIPLGIAAMPGGGSRVAWLSGHTRYGSSADNQVHVAELGCDDQLIGSPFSLEAYDFSDIAADAEGGVVLLTRDAEGSGEQHCGDVNNLCILPQDRPGCYDMYLVRFDNAGNEVWATKLTSSSAQNPPYSANDGWNHFIWWYQHHGRLAHDGSNYAAYFCDAITVTNNSCGGNVDIHQGDRMQVVGPSGALLDHPDAFDGGCSHSWNTRIVWDAATDRFVLVCATDNNNRVAAPAPYRTIFDAPDIGTLSVGGLVLASGGGYWVSVSYQGTLHLLHFTEALPNGDIAVDHDLTAGSSDFSHLVAYGDRHMILAWESGSGMTAQVRDAATGAAVGEPFSIDVPDHRYQAFKAFPDGSVAYAAQGPNSQTVRIARVLPCE